jgi:hypothetical protein
MIAQINKGQTGVDRSKKSGNFARSPPPEINQADIGGYRPGVDRSSNLHSDVLRTYLI